MEPREGLAEARYEAGSEIEALRWEYHRRTLELERRAMLWRLLAGTVGFFAGFVAGAL
jgi:hypothetical protein